MNKLFSFLAFFFFLFSFFFFSCGNDDPHMKKQTDPDKFKNQLVKVNKYEVEKESDEIDQYIARHSWPMEKTATGLRYMILSKGSGNQAKPGDYVKVNYKIALLETGRVCYSSEKDRSAYEFKVEGDAIESGLHEAIQLMHAGDKAVFIVPSYLAHGLHGDDAEIPPLASLVVDIELLEIK